MDILVVAAHPDDEVLGCGGTVARLSNEGHTVYSAILGEGSTSRFRQGTQGKRAALNKLRKSCEKAARILGIRKVFPYQLPDNRFDTVPMLDVIRIVEDLLLKLKPSMVYTHHSGDLNIDHAITSRAVLTAARPLKECTVRELYAFEIPSSTEWSFGSHQPLFMPNTFMDIRQTLATKIQAMGAYESEVREFPHPRSPEALKATAEKWGATSGLCAAEAFCLVWSRK